jgi:hypothetical protein
VVVFLVNLESPAKASVVAGCGLVAWFVVRPERQG